MKLYLKPSVLIKTVFIIVFLLSISPQVYAQCFANADCNGDGITLSINDMVFLVNFLYNCGSTPPDLFNCDLNGDCIVDTNDVHVYEEYMSIGLPAFAPWGGYPVPTCCEPIVIRADIVANLFGMQHISRGSACLEAIDDTLHISDLDLVPGSLYNGFDAKPMMLPGFKGWNCRFVEDPSLPVGASILSDFSGIVDGLPDQFVASLRQDKRPDGKWDIWVQALPGVYQINGYLGGNAIRQDRGSWTTNNTAWVNIGTLGTKVKGPNHGPYDMSVANMDDAGKIDICFGTEDSAMWSWENEGIINQLVTTVSFRNIDTDHVWIQDISSLSQFGENLSAYAIANENYTFSFEDYNITNIGNAVIDYLPASYYAVVNQDSTKPCGLAFRPDPITQQNYDYTYFLLYEEPSTPVNGSYMCSAVDESFPAESFFDVFASGTPPPSPDFPAESFFDVYYSMTQKKSSPSEWNVKVFSIIPATYSVVASLDGTVLFTSAPVPATGSYVDIGTVGSSAKIPDLGPHPFRIEISNESGIISLEQPDSLIYNWPSESVADLKIDKLQVIIHHGPLGFELIPAITAKNIPEFDIHAESGKNSCCNHDGIRGDANLDGSILVDDLVLLVNYLFKSGPTPACIDEGDANGSGLILVDDLTLLVNYLFKSGLPPVTCP
ncbi:MAG: dockerin type I repeat-containing protein [bacterium]